MSTAQLKLLTWSVAGILAVTLSGYIALFVKDLETVRTPVPKEEITEVLNNVEEIVEEADEIVSYDRVQAGIIDFNWTGQEARPVEVAEEEPEEPSVNRATPVRDLVRVIYLQVDPIEAAQSRVLVVYHPASNVRLSNTYDGLMRVGDTLMPPHGYIKLVDVTAEGAVFGFEDEERARETLLPEEFAVDHRITTAIGAQLGQTRDRPRRIGFRSAGEAPRRTQLYGEGNRVRIGTEDMDHIAENYSEILSTEVRTARHRDPRTGKYDGVEIRSLSPDSTVARHGGRQGDVIKSINGHAVNSVSDAVTYVKQNANMHSGSWEIVVENMGKTRTVYVDPPKQQ